MTKLALISWRRMAAEHVPEPLLEQAHVAAGLAQSPTTVVTETHALDRAKGFYDSLPRWGKPLDKANRQRIEETVALVPPHVHTVLDLGCGDGTVSNELITKGMSIVGVDISTDALRYFDGEGIAASVDQLPFCNHSFDLVICAQVLEHLRVGIYERAVEEIERVAGKFIIITTPNEEYLPKHFVQCKRCGTVQHADFHVRAFDREAHHTLLQGFALVKTVEISLWRQCRLMTLFRQRVFGYPGFRPGLTCPSCGSKSVERPRQRSLRKIRAGADRLLNRIACCSAPRWIASLYESSTPQQSAHR